MPSTITTTGTTSDPITTSRLSGETVRVWIGRHSDSVLGATPNGDKLTTTWTSSGVPQETATNRNSGESDANFLDRHVKAYQAQMIDFPPS